MASLTAEAGPVTAIPVRNRWVQQGPDFVDNAEKKTHYNAADFLSVVELLE
jgi:hypothetical protein